MIDLREVEIVGAGRTLLTVDALAIDVASPTVIVGPSGAGKSTLLRTIAGLMKPVRGAVELDGVPREQLARREQSRWFAWLPQLMAPDEWLTVVDYLAGARYAFDESRATARRHIVAALEECGVAALADAPVPRLSGGELQRVQLAGLLAQDTRFLLLDEPGNHLDPALVEWLHGWLARRVGLGQGLIAVSHDLRIITSLERHTGASVRVVGLAEGRVRFDRSSDESGLPEELEALFGVPWAEVTVGGARHLLPQALP